MLSLSGASLDQIAKVQELCKLHSDLKCDTCCCALIKIVGDTSFSTTFYYEVPWHNVQQH